MWVTKLLISEVKKRIFCPKTTKFGPKLAFLVNLGQAMQVYSVPCWWVGWWLWRVGCISQDTYLLYKLVVFLLRAVDDLSMMLHLVTMMLRLLLMRAQQSYIVGDFSLCIRATFPSTASHLIHIITTVRG